MFVDWVIFGTTVYILSIWMNLEYYYITLHFISLCRRCKMYSGHTVWLFVCVSAPRRMPTLLHGPGRKLANGRGFPLVVVHYWADLQSMHEFRCYNNIQVFKLIALYTANAYSTAKCQAVLALCLVNYSVQFISQTPIQSKVHNHNVLKEAVTVIK